VSTTRELENLIIDVTYADLLGGKMYHHEEMFHVDWASGRDVSKDGLVKVQAGLQTW
jgi:COP9 signalosome complex subunit 7